MYRVLYRKWRPQTFSEVSDQSHITTTLKNELINNRVAHAYLFTGSRGTGKTTCAKILSKAVNCLHPVDGDPCNECEVCKGIDNGSILDVIEIDAASNNGVDNIRDLRDEANFMPVKAKYRVYIIDEVHMLSTGAFNALLKILEEPPEYVIFILATTEVHKLPATILSRCQRFDFKRITQSEICKRLQYVCDKENLTLDPDAADLIAKIADGAMRDALSLLDRCCAVSDHITAEVVTKNAGLAGRDHLFTLTRSIIKKDCASALGTINELHMNSCDMERLCSEYLLHLRDLLIAKTVKSAENILICSADELNQLNTLAENINLEDLLYCIDVLQSTLGDIKRSSNKRIPLEMAFVRMCSEQLDSNNEALLRRIAALEAKIYSGSAPVTAPDVKNNLEAPAIVQPQKEIEPKPSFAEAEPQENPAPAKIEKPHFEEPTTVKEPVPPAPPVQTKPVEASASPASSGETEPFERWAEVIAELRNTDMPLVGILNGASAYTRDNFLLIKSDNPVLSSFIKKDLHASFLSKAIYTVTGRQYKIGLYKAHENLSSKDPLEGLVKKIESLKNN